MPSLSKNPRLYSLIVLLILALTWGSSYILIKKALLGFSATQVAGLRITLSSLAFLPVFWWKRRAIDWRRWPWLVVVGLAGSGIPAFLFPFAQTQISSSLSGLLSSLTPLFTLILAILVFRKIAARQQFWGIFIGLVGAAVLVFASRSEAVSGNVGYAFLVIVATMCYGLSSNVVAEKLKGMGSLTISASSFFLIFPLGLAALYFTDVVHTFQTVPEARTVVWAVVFLSLAGTVAASVLFFKLVQLTGAVFASTVSYLTPVVAVFWGLVDGEVLGGLHFLGMVLALTGVYLSRR